jgi:hypothetical protein
MWVRLGFMGRQPFPDTDAPLPVSQVCVSTTAREAHQRGYEVLIVEDAVGDRDIPGASGEDVTKVSKLSPTDTCSQSSSVAERHLPSIMQHALNELKDFFATTIKSSDIQ